MMSPSVFFVAALAGIAYGMPSDIPQIVPGPGLPSLESMGLTSAQVYSLGQDLKAGNSTLSHRSLTARDPGDEVVCNPDGHDSTCDSNLAYACAAYLKALEGDPQCIAPSTGETFCTAGNCNVLGVGLHDKPSQIDCLKVGNTVDQITRDCDKNNQVFGQEPANGDGNLLIIVSHVNAS